MPRSSWLSSALALVALHLIAGAARPASATLLEATASTFTGDWLEVSLTVDDASAPGDLVITLSVSGPGTTTGDLRGFFLNIADDSLLAGLSVTGPDVTSTSVLAHGVASVGPGNTLKGGGSPCPCDLGVELGTPGIGHDDLQTVTFTISHATASLDASLVAGQSFGVRVTSVGDGRCRDGSSKLKGEIPVVPEPGPSVLMGLGLMGLAIGSRRIR